MSFPRYESYKDSGIEWLGDVPAHWGVGKFRHNFSESSEKIETDIVGEMLSVSGYRGIEIKEYDDENRRRLDSELVGYRVVRPGQLVVNTMWLNYAGLGVSDFEGHVSPAYRSYWISNTLNKRFVHHLMRSDIYVKGYTKFLTGIRPNSLQMSRDDLMVFPILKPPLAEQQNIAFFLDRETAKIDALIAEQQRLIELLKEKRQAVISHAVTKGLNPNAPMKDSGIEWLGDVPAHWAVVPIKRICEIKDGTHDTPKYVDQSEESFPLITSKDFEGDSICFEHAKFISREDHLEIIKRSNTEFGDVLMSMIGGNIGKALIVKDKREFSIKNVALFKTLDNHDLGLYILNYLQSGLLDIQISLLSRGGAQGFLSLGDIRNLLFFKIPQKEMGTIVIYLSRYTSKLDELIQEANHQIELLQERRTALISAAVTGKIDVRGFVTVSAQTEAAA
jgi:type I restriction enzyme S subunit